MSTTADRAESLSPDETAPEPVPEPETPEQPGEPAGDPSPPGPAEPESMFLKLARVMGELSAIPSSKMRHVKVDTRDGGSYSYDYITEATMMEELRPRLAREGIAVMYSDKIIRHPEEGDNLTVVKVDLTFVDGRTGEKWNSSAEGYGTDRGDKGANKAKTTALRYLLWKTFLFASDLDPETESVERRSSGGGARSGVSGNPATDKQKGMINGKLTKLDEAGVTDFDNRRPQDAVFVRRPVEDLDSSTASKLIDLLIEVEKAQAAGTPDIAGRLSAALDAMLGPVNEAAGDFPPPPETVPSDMEDVPFGESYGG